MPVRPPNVGPGTAKLPRYANGWMHQFGHIYALQHELLRRNEGEIYRKNNQQHSWRTNWFHACELWHTARREGIPLNVAHYSNILRQCVSGRAPWNQSLDILRQMRREGLRADTTIVGLVLSHCSDASRWEESLQVIDYFANKKKLFLSEHCRRAAILAAERAGRQDVALQLASVEVRCLPKLTVDKVGSLEGGTHPENALDPVAVLRPKQKEPLRHVFATSERL